MAWSNVEDDDVCFATAYDLTSSAGLAGHARARLAEVAHGQERSTTSWPRPFPSQPMGSGGGG